MVKLSSLVANPLDASLSYDLIRSPFTLVSFLQVFLLVFAVALSVRKPWGKRLSYTPKPCK